MTINPSAYEVPLTASDLRGIAKVLDETARKFGEPEIKGLTTYGANFDDIELVLNRPGSGDPVGVIAYYDGWLGFHPYSTTRTSTKEN